MGPVDQKDQALSHLPILLKTLEKNQIHAASALVPLCVCRPTVSLQGETVKTNSRFHLQGVWAHPPATALQELRSNGSSRLWGFFPLANS